jgi:hypothetical protein
MVSATDVNELVCKNSVADVKVNEGKAINSTNEFALIVSY